MIDVPAIGLLPRSPTVGDEPADLWQPCGQPLPHALIMTSSTPTSKTEEQLPSMAMPVGAKPWWLH